MRDLVSGGLGEGQASCKPRPSTLGIGNVLYIVLPKVTKWVAPALCAEDSGKANMTAEERVTDTMGHFIDNVERGQIFTSTNPNTVDSDCVPYPHEQARFCAALGQTTNIRPSPRNDPPQVVVKTRGLFWVPYRPALTSNKTCRIVDMSWLSAHRCVFSDCHRLWIPYHGVP